MMEKQSSAIACPLMRTWHLKSEFDFLSEQLNPSNAYFVYDLNNGYDMTKNSDGTDSLLYRNLYLYYMDLRIASLSRAKTFIGSFKTKIKKILRVKELTRKDIENIPFENFESIFGDRIEDSKAVGGDTSIDQLLERAGIHVQYVSYKDIDRLRREHLPKGNKISSRKNEQLIQTASNVSIDVLHYEDSELPIIDRHTPYFFDGDTIYVEEGLKLEDNAPIRAYTAIFDYALSALDPAYGKKLVDTYKNDTLVHDYKRMHYSGSEFDAAVAAHVYNTMYRFDSWKEQMTKENAANDAFLKTKQLWHDMIDHIRMYNNEPDSALSSQILSYGYDDLMDIPLNALCFDPDNVSSLLSSVVHRKGKYQDVYAGVQVLDNKGYISAKYIPTAKYGLGSTYNWYEVTAKIADSLLYLSAAEAQILHNENVHDTIKREAKKYNLLPIFHTIPGLTKEYVSFIGNFDYSDFSEDIENSNYSEIGKYIEPIHALLERMFPLITTVMKTIPGKEPAYISNGVIYFDPKRISGKQLIEEYMHPLVHIIRAKDSELFNKILKEAETYYGSFCTNIRNEYSQLYKLKSGVDKNAVDEEIVAQILAAKSANVITKFADLREAAWDHVSDEIRQAFGHSLTTDNAWMDEETRLFVKTSNFSKFISESENIRNLTLNDLANVMFLSNAKFFLSKNDVDKVLKMRTMYHRDPSSYSDAQKHDLDNAKSSIVKSLKELVKRYESEEITEGNDVALVSKSKELISRLKTLDDVSDMIDVVNFANDIIQQDIDKLEWHRSNGFYSNILFLDLMNMKYRHIDFFQRLYGYALLQLTVSGRNLNTALTENKTNRDLLVIDQIKELCAQITKANAAWGEALYNRLFQFAKEYVNNNRMYKQMNQQQRDNVVDQMMAAFIGYNSFMPDEILNVGTFLRYFESYDNSDNPVIATAFQILYQALLNAKIKTLPDMKRLQRAYHFNTIKPSHVGNSYQAAMCEYAVENGKRKMTGFFRRRLKYGLFNADLNEFQDFVQFGANGRENNTTLKRSVRKEAHSKAARICSQIDAFLQDLARNGYVLDKYAKEAVRIIKASILNDGLNGELGVYYKQDDDDPFGTMIDATTGKAWYEESWHKDAAGEWHMPNWYIYQTAGNIFKSINGERRYTFQYYQELMSRPYEYGKNKNKLISWKSMPHGLSPNTLFQYNNLTERINTYLDKCTSDKDGFIRPWLLTDYERLQLQIDQQELDRLKSFFDINGMPKTGEDLLTAYELSTWDLYKNSFIEDSSTHWQEYKDLEQEAMAYDAKLVQDGKQPHAYADFLQQCSKFGVDKELLQLAYTKTGVDLMMYPQYADAKMWANSLKALVKGNYDQIRDLEQYINCLTIGDNSKCLLFWYNCRLQDLALDGSAIPNDAIKVEKDYVKRKFIPHFGGDGLPLYVYNNNIISGTQYNQLSDIEKQNATEYTEFEYMLDTWTDFIDKNGTLPGFDLVYLLPFGQVRGNRTNRQFVHDLLTYPKHTTKGDLIDLHAPLSIFMITVPDESLQIFTASNGDVRPGLGLLPIGNFLESSSPLVNTNYDKSEQLEIVPKEDKYFDDGFDSMHKSMNSPAGNLYDLLIETMKKALDNYNFSNKVFDYRIPNVPAKFTANISRGNFKTALKNIIEITENDDLYRSTGNSESLLPAGDLQANKRYILITSGPNKTDTTTLSTDLEASVCLYLYASALYKERLAVIPELLAMREALRPEMHELVPKNFAKQSELKDTPNTESMFDELMSIYAYETFKSENSGEQASTRGGNAKQRADKLIKEVGAASAKWSLLRNFGAMIAGVAAAALSLPLGVVSSSLTQLLGFGGELNIYDFTKACVQWAVNIIPSLINMRSNTVLSVNMPAWLKTKQGRGWDVVKKVWRATTTTTPMAYMQYFGVDFNVKEFINNTKGVGNFWHKVATSGMAGFSFGDYQISEIALLAYLRGRKYYEGNQIIPEGFYDQREIVNMYRASGVDNWWAKALLYTLKHFASDSMYDAYNFDEDTRTLTVKDKYKHLLDPNNPEGSKRYSEFTRNISERLSVINGTNPKDPANYGIKQTTGGGAVFALRSFILTLINRYFGGYYSTSTKKSVNTKTKREWNNGKMREYETESKAKYTPQDSALKMHINPTTGQVSDATMINGIRGIFKVLKTAPWIFALGVTKLASLLGSKGERAYNHVKERNAFVRNGVLAFTNMEIEQMINLVTKLGVVFCFLIPQFYVPADAWLGEKTEQSVELYQREHPDDDLNRLYFPYEVHRGQFVINNPVETCRRWKDRMVDGPAAYALARYTMTRVFVSLSEEVSASTINDMLTTFTTWSVPATNIVTDATTMLTATPDKWTANPRKGTKSGDYTKPDWAINLLITLNMFLKYARTFMPSTTTAAYKYYHNNLLDNTGTVFNKWFGLVDDQLAKDKKSTEPKISVAGVSDNTGVQDNSGTSSNTGVSDNTGVIQ